MNEARKFEAEGFARVVMGDEGLRRGLEAMLEVLEYSLFERWKAQPAPEAWRSLAGELAALRSMGERIRTLGLTREVGDGAR